MSDATSQFCIAILRYLTLSSFNDYRIVATSVNFEMVFWGHQFPPKNERKHVEY